MTVAVAICSLSFSVSIVSIRLPMWTRPTGERWVWGPNRTNGQVGCINNDFDGCAEINCTGIDSRTSIVNAVATRILWGHLRTSDGVAGRFEERTGNTVDVAKDDRILSVRLCYLPDIRFHPGFCRHITIRHHPPHLCDYYWRYIW